MAAYEVVKLLLGILSIVLSLVLARRVARLGESFRFVLLIVSFFTRAPIECTRR
jgi:hypothetical protein